jgi:hypothetical protein
MAPFFFIFEIDIPYLLRYGISDKSSENLVTIDRK